jgi:hypothetical protein
MTIPAILFGIVLSTTYGTVFHLWKDGSLKKLILFIILAWLGFWAGHFFGGLMKWNFASVGPVNTGAATLGSALFLLVGEWLSRVEITHK